MSFLSKAIQYFFRRFIYDRYPRQPSVESAIEKVFLVGWRISYPNGFSDLYFIVALGLHFSVRFTASILANGQNQLYGEYLILSWYWMPFYLRCASSNFILFLFDSFSAFIINFQDYLPADMMTRFCICDQPWFRGFLIIYAIIGLNFAGCKVDLAFWKANPLIASFFFPHVVYHFLCVYIRSNISYSWVWVGTVCHACGLWCAESFDQHGLLNVFDDIEYYTKHYVRKHGDDTTRTSNYTWSTQRGSRHSLGIGSSVPQ